MTLRLSEKALIVYQSTVKKVRAQVSGSNNAHQKAIMLIMSFTFYSYSKYRRLALVRKDASDY